MKIKASTLVEVNLSKEQQREITLKYLFDLYGWEPAYFIKDENIYNNVEYHSHNSWYEDVLVRTATDDDYVMASLLLKIKESK
jgi:hypothetical protein